MSADQAAVPQQTSAADSDPASVPAPATDTETEANAPAGSVEEFPHKVFVGNVAFSTTEKELKDFFAPAGNVCEAKIITRGARSLGYGFVAFEKPEECEEAVAKLSKKELGGREINVEVAKPQSSESRPRKPRGRRNPRRPKKNTQESDDGEIITHAEADPAGNADGTGEKRRHVRKSRPRRKPGSSEGKKSEGRGRGRRPLGEASKTAVFVANLPFSMDDAGLLEVFKGYKVKSASVVLRKGSGRSKGFGFVDFESEEEQQRLLSSDVRLVAEERELSVKVALRDEKPTETSEGDLDKEEPVTSTTTTTTTTTAAAAAATPAPVEAES